MSIHRLELAPAQPARKISVEERRRRRGMANVLQGLSPQDLASLHRVSRKITPPPPPAASVRLEGSDDDVDDNANQLPGRFRTRRNAVVYNPQAEQFIRNIVMDPVNGAGANTAAHAHNGGDAQNGVDAHKGGNAANGADVQNGAQALSNTHVDDVHITISDGEQSQ